MSNYSHITKRILSENKNNKLSEKFGSILYHDGINEMMHPDIESAILNGQHSLSNCGVFPESNIPFHVALIGDRFKDVVLNGREAFDTNNIDPNDMYLQMSHLFEETVKMEESNKTDLEKLAVEIISEEFDIPEGAINFEVELTNNIPEKNKSKKQKEDIVFEDHDELVQGNDEIKKRRVINALIVGATKNIDDLYHFNRNNLKNINTKLPSNYKKILAADDFLSYSQPETNDLLQVGDVNVIFEKDKKDKIIPTVKAKAMIFPILIAELYKGVMEIISTHGIPKNPKLLEYAINNADYDEAKPWDERIGPKMWSIFCSEIPKKDLGLKHLVFAKSIKKPAKEFLHDIREIMSKTKNGKQIILDILSEVKHEVEINEYIKEINDTHFEIDDLI